MFEQGFLNAGITLAARHVFSPTWWLTNHPPQTGPDRFSFRYQPGTGLFEVRREVFLLDPFGPFPYGIPVDPP